jgi:eukaryotic-like serine/threonine-protein kinase
VARRYVIQRFITRGGMGEVYEAFDRELSQRVALKTVTSTASDNSSAVRRLKAEVQLARRVSHANVCRIYDLGTHELPEGGGEIHFLTMAYVERRDGNSVPHHHAGAGECSETRASRHHRRRAAASRFGSRDDD